MGMPWKTIAKMGLSVAGAKLPEDADEELLEVDKQLLETLKAQLKQQTITNMILMKMLEDQDEFAAKELMDEIYED